MARSIVYGRDLRVDMWIRVLGRTHEIVDFLGGGMGTRIAVYLDDNDVEQVITVWDDEAFWFDSGVATPRHWEEK